MASLQIDLHCAADALGAALALEDPRLVGALTRSLRMTLIANNAADADRLATQSLLLRQLDRVAQTGAFSEAKPILSAFRSSAG